MKSWQDIYDVIADDANGTTIYRPANCDGDGQPEKMCVMGGLALAAGLDIRSRYFGTSEVVDFVLDKYPLTYDQCNYLVSVNDSHELLAKRREALIAKVREYEAQDMVDALEVQA